MAMRGIDRVVAGVGVVFHLAVGVFPFAASGLVAPLWGIVVLYLWWIALLVVIIRLVRGGRPLLTPAVPVVALIGWLALVSFGGAVLGWTA